MSMANSSVEPYQFEPIKRPTFENKCSDISDNSSDADISCSDDEDNIANRHRLGNNDWCSCGVCEPMPTPTESLCCTEVSDIERRAEDEGVNCITKHPGFIANCLNKHVLDVALIEFAEVDGPLDDNEPIHETYRYIAYRRFAKFIWLRLGKKMRKVLPSCVVTNIRRAFPSEEYTGFKYVHV